MGKEKVYELTDKSYKKHYVRGIKNDNEAKALAKKVFGKHYFDISYYDDYPSKYGVDWEKDSMTKVQFIKLKWRYK